MSTEPGVFCRCANASMAPVSSILLLVVIGDALPSSTTRPSGVAMIAPHPPGPGFPLAAPSEKTTIDWSVTRARYQTSALLDLVQPNDPHELTDGHARRQGRHGNSRRVIHQLVAGIDLHS